jgi:hypothetical protein
MPETASEKQKQKQEQEREGKQETGKLAKLMIAGRLNT